MSDYNPRAGVDARTRDGRRATNIRRIDDPIYSFEGDIDGRTLSWTETGNYWFGTEGGAFDLVADWQEPVSPAPSAGPVRMVTRPEIVPGVYGRVKVETTSSDFRQVILALTEPNRVGDFWLTASELRAASETLSQLADAMEQESKL